MKKIARRRRLERIGSNFFGIVGIAGLLITIIAWLYPELPAQVKASIFPSAASTHSTGATPADPKSRP
jgi:hypothetical protein